MDYSKKVVNIKDINYGQLINKYSEEYIYSVYLGYYPELNKKYKSPFKQEKTPSFVFYIKDGKLKFKDFSSAYYGTAVDLVMAMFSITFSEAVIKIHNDLCNDNSKIVSYNKILKTTKSKVIEVITKEYSQEDIDYWEQYYFDITILDKYNIKPCEEVWLNDGYKDILIYKYIKTNPCYRYLFNGKYKIYKPLETNKKHKWISSCNNYDNIQGIEQLQKGDSLIITKSYKDVICFNEFINIPSIAFHGEGHYIDEKTIKWLKKEYKYIYIFYDNDSTGIEQANKLSNLYNIPYIYIPRYFLDKDLSDYIKSYGIQEGKKIINQLIK